MLALAAINEGLYDAYTLETFDAVTRAWFTIATDTRFTDGCTTFDVACRILPRNTLRLVARKGNASEVALVRHAS